jgi:hypothetical protein
MSVNTDHFVLTDSNLEFNVVNPPVLHDLMVNDLIELRGPRAGPFATLSNAVVEHRATGAINTYHLNAPSTGILNLPLCRVKHFSSMKVTALISGAVNGKIEMDLCAQLHPSYSLIEGSDSKRVLGSSLVGNEASLIVIHDDSYNVKEFAVSYNLPAGCNLVAFVEHHYVNYPDPALFPS